MSRNIAELADERRERLLILEYSSTAVARVRQRDGDVYRFEFSRGADNTVAVGTRTADGRCDVSTMQLGRKTAHFGAPYPEAEADWPPMTAERTSEGALSAEVATVLAGVRAEAETSTERPLRFDAGGAPCRCGASGARPCCDVCRYHRRPSGAAGASTPTARVRSDCWRSIRARARWARSRSPRRA